MKITYKEIATMINKTEANIKYIKKTNPELLNILKLGCLCKKKNIRATCRFPQTTHNLS